MTAKSRFHEPARTNRYDLMDAAYDAAEIRAHSESLGQVPIIDVNPRNSAALKRNLQQEAKARRTLGQGYAKECATGTSPARRFPTVDGGARQRSAEGRIRARQVRVRGHRKVLCHLVRGTGVDRDQLLRFVN